MAATEQIFKQLINQLCAADFGGDPTSYPGSGLAELCFPHYDNDDQGEDATAWIPRVHVVDEPHAKNPTKFILDAAQMHQIACYVLPRDLAYHRWRRLFSAGRDGGKFETFMNRVSKDKRTLLVLRTTKGEVFGGFSDGMWEFNNQYFHGGEQTKLFTFVRSEERHGSMSSDEIMTCTIGESRDDSEEKTEKKKDAVTVYSWTGLNRDFQYCDDTRSLLGFGGGGARFGLSVQKNFRFGSTGPCETFGNSKLGSDESFRILDIEVWGFVAVEDTCCSSLLCFQPDHRPEEDINWIPSVRVVREGPNKAENFILDQAKMNQIARFVLPRTIASCRWKRVYSLSRDGDSFETCLRLVRNEERSLMVIKTEDNQIFGGYADSPWRPYNCNYYGSAQASLWTFAKDKPTNNSTGLDMSGSMTLESSDPNKVKVFKWTGINRYIQYCDVTHRILAFGGGGDAGSFGLCVEKEFQQGTTGPCATFGNEPLCNSEHFKIIDLEIYGFAVGKF